MKHLIAIAAAAAAVLAATTAAAQPYGYQSRYYDRSYAPPYYGGNAYYGSNYPGVAARAYVRPYLPSVGRGYYSNRRDVYRDRHFRRDVRRGWRGAYGPRRGYGVGRW